MRGESGPIDHVYGRVTNRPAAIDLTKTLSTTRVNTGVSIAARPAEGDAAQLCSTESGSRSFTSIADRQTARGLRRAGGA